MITFTVPEQLRRFICGNQRQSYAALFSSSSQALKALGKRSKDGIGIGIGIGDVGIGDVARYDV